MNLLQVNKPKTSGHHKRCQLKWPKYSNSNPTSITLRHHHILASTTVLKDVQQQEKYNKLNHYVWRMQAYHKYVPDMSSNRLN